MTNNDTRPMMLAQARFGVSHLFCLWHTPGAADGEFHIYDSRCPRAHAHAVWSGTHEGAGYDALSALAKNPPPFLPCAPGVEAFEPCDA